MTTMLDVSGRTVGFLALVGLSGWRIYLCHVRLEAHLEDYLAAEIQQTEVAKSLRSETQRRYVSNICIALRECCPS